MNETDYKAVLNDTLRKLGTIGCEIERLNVEVAKLRQFFAATLNMLPDSERKEFTNAFKEVAESIKSKESSLKDAILSVLRQSFPKFLTSADVRDRLTSSGFDFSDYTSNPLASISTTLRRFKPDEVEETTIEGVSAYRSTRPRLKELVHGFRPGTRVDVGKK